MRMQQEEKQVVTNHTGETYVTSVKIKHTGCRFNKQYNIWINVFSLSLSVTFNPHDLLS